MQAPDGFVETFKHFCDRHSEPQFLPANVPACPVKVGGTSSRFLSETYLLPSGAGYTQTELGGQQTFEPVGERQTLENRRQYLQSRLGTAERTFESLRLALIAQNTPADEVPRLDWRIRNATFNWTHHQDREFGPQPADQYGQPRGTAALMRLKEIVAGYRAILADLDAAYDALPEVVAERKAKADAELSEKQWREQHNASKRHDRALIEKVTL